MVAMSPLKKWLVFAITSGILVSACSGATTTPGSSASGSSASGSAPSADLAYAQAQIDKYSALPQFQVPGGAFNPAAAKGKSIFFLPSASTVPFCEQAAAQMKELTDGLGMTFEVWKSQGELSQWVQGMQQAVQKKVDVINLFCGLDPARIVPQIQAAKQAGIPVVASHTYAVGQEVQPDLAAIVYGAYTAASRAMVDWVILQTKGDANVLVITVPTTSSSTFMEAAIKDEFAKYCSSCKVDYVGVNVPDWAANIPLRVQSAITANPKLNYVIPIYDGMVQFVVPAILASNAASRVQIATFNATPAVLDQIRTGDIVTFDVGEDTGWLAGATVDQTLRVLLGQPLVKDYAPGLRAFTKDNVADAGVPAKVGQGYGTAAIEGYKELWGLGN